METEETAETTDRVFLSSHSDMWGYKLVLPSYKLLVIIRIKDDVPPPCTDIVRRDIRSTPVYGKSCVNHWSTIFWEKIFNLFLISSWQAMDSFQDIPVCTAQGGGGSFKDSKL